MNKYERLKKELEELGEGKMKCFGNYMTPILESGSLLTFKKQETYAIGDIVFCKNPKGRGYIDAHKITKIDAQGRYMIANNHNFENGWTKTIFGKMVSFEGPNK